MNASIIVLRNTIRYRLHQLKAMCAFTWHDIAMYVLTLAVSISVAVLFWFLGVWSR